MSYGNIQYNLVKLQTVNQLLTTVSWIILDCLWTSAKVILIERFWLLRDLRVLERILTLSKPIAQKEHLLLNLVVCS